MNRHETFHTYGLKPKLLFCLNISALCSHYNLNHWAPISTVLSQRTAQPQPGCVSCFPPSRTTTSSLLINAFSSSCSLLRSGSHEELASSQPCLAIGSNSHVRRELPHTLLCSQRLCTTSLHARSQTTSAPPCLHATPASHPLLLVEQNPNTLYILYLAIISKAAQILCCASLLLLRILIQQWYSLYPTKSY